ncbi:hypothetical protein HYU11_04360 [Candidatus Woesearchaeota archaeon]|nr:hypothetical protein [Candidatus Woesearchaeota archaeon]
MGFVEVSMSVLSSGAWKIAGNSWFLGNKELFGKILDELEGKCILSIKASPNRHYENLYLLANGK